MRRTQNDGQLVLEGIPDIPETIIDQLNRYQHVRGAGVRDWTPDGHGLYILTRFADVTQLHRVDQPGGARHQLTFFDEPINSVMRIPASDRLCYAMDQGGNENSQLFVLDPRRGDSTLLTDGSSRNGAALWNRSGTKLAFYSTRRNGRANDVWIVDPTDRASARLVWESHDGSWWAPLDWSHDDRVLLIQQYLSVNDSRIHLLDLTAARRRC